MGPTASGKTPLAESISDELNALLVNADAFQIYRGLDIGTAKPEAKSRYELLDIKNPNEAFGVGEWVSRCVAILEAAYAAGRNVVVVGGTGLYIRALFEEYSAMQPSPDPALRKELENTPMSELRVRLVNEFPALAAKTDLNNPVRVRRALERMASPAGAPVKVPQFQRLKFAIECDPQDLEQRFIQRVDEMVQNGWVNEIEGLRAQGFSRADPAFRAIGYRLFWDHLERKIDFDEARMTTIIQTRQYAKRQRTWLRSEPRIHRIASASLRDMTTVTRQHISNVFK
jgi:tRNA dimethylallyltransferase